MGPQFLCKLPLFGWIEFGTEYRFYTSRRKCWLHHHGIKMIQHPIQRVWLSTPPSRDGRELKRLAKQMCGKTGKERHNRGCLNQAASQCIGYNDVSSYDRVNQTWHTEKRIAPQFERIAKAIIDSAQDYIHSLQPINCLEINGPVTHCEIRSRDQGKSKVSSYI
jgi:hypothetical protein